MRIAVIGSRNFENFNLMVETMHWIIYEENECSFDNVTIVSGEVPGADLLAKRYASEFNLGYIGIVTTILSIYTHTWIPVVLAVLMDIFITGIMIELNKE